MTNTNSYSVDLVDFEEQRNPFFCEDYIVDEFDSSSRPGESIFENNAEDSATCMLAEMIDESQLKLSVESWSSFAGETEPAGTKFAIEEARDVNILEY